MQRGIALGGLVLLGVVLGGVAVADEDWQDLVEDDGAPYVDAGLDQEVVLGDEVLLDGGGTWDDQDDITAREWIIETPDGGIIQPECPDCWFTRFTPATTGQYNATLTVRDAKGHENSDTLFVTVGLGGGAIPPDGADTPATNGSGGQGDEACWVANSADGAVIDHRICDDHSTAIDFEMNDGGGIQHVVFEEDEVSRHYSERIENRDGTVTVPIQVFQEEARDAWSSYKVPDNTHGQNTGSGDNSNNGEGNNDDGGNDSNDLCANYPGTGCPY